MGIDYRRIFQNIPGMFLVLLPDAGFTIVAASEEYLRATRSPRGIVSRGLFEVFPETPSALHAATMDNLRKSLARVLVTKTADAMPVQRYDLPLAEPGDGAFEERHWSPVNSPVLSDDGTVAYIIHRVDDITERVRADQNFRATEILDSITEGFYALDRDWRFTYVNREARRILGGTRDDMQGKVVWDVYPGLVGSEFERTYRHAMEKREAATLTAHYADHDRWYEVHAYPAPYGVSIYFRNVTRQRLSEAQNARLAAESERVRRIYEAALSNTPDLVYVFDLQYRFVYANKALLGMWGKTAEDALGKRCLELGYEPWHAEMHEREIDQVARTRQPIRGEVPFNGTGGRRIYDYIFAPVVGPAGEVVAVAGTTRDVTERHLAEQSIREQALRLSEADRAKDEFLATLAHELRNPLAPLRNALSTLRLSERENATDVPVHAMMLRQVNHLVRLVDDLLEMSRINRGSFPLREEHVDVASIVRNALETSAPLIEAAGHRLQTSLPDTPLWLDGDPVRLAQILSNLLNNATRYTDDGGTLRLRAWQEDGHAVVSVRDNGVGIAADALPRMFEMFSRGDRADVRGQGGLGIGLALSRKLAAMHGGTLEAHSAGLGQGSEFLLRVPLASQQTADPVPAAVPEPPQLQQRILVVDDNRDAADSLGVLLELLGAEVRVAHDGKKALETLDRYDPSVVLLDIGMPGMDGYEVARAIRSRFPQRRTAIVALTGWGQDDDRRRTSEAGFDHHLVKPAEIGTLQSLLASIAGSASNAPSGAG